MNFLDTNFLIDLLRGKVDDDDLLDELDRNGPHVTNTIVQFEFLFGGYNSKRSDEVDKRKSLLKKMIILPVDERSADEAAKLGSALKNKGESIGNADCLILGTMISH
ncbi:MAG: type II toxin-antitoxin system VapC family toxin, partial [Candidatus Heimdallarchaeota archaeon]|nr:type II toxin-antitoxin system VapC family toxin [Candidatus Heimdallarchaeota archaeon]